ncbi:HAD family phosphatase [Bacteriovorax sp. Seq25_V]|uniref:HAD family hydrolase n=1 Tax=Bacteriovorax sp. Seq25_V TaxID=1201288 RepID=UPI000389E084|nr:HAD family phosphatase [Bacteriovorax sp. Seq25_V]EQC43756.1 haloacid dehalogenase-like hydrolase [Bacteriovorax sp. Seq25_V]
MKLLNFDLNSYDALLFDLDGTVVDSVEIHDQAWVDTFRDYGVTVDFDFLKKTTGMASTRIVRIVNETFKVQLDPNKLATEKRNRYLQNLPNVKLIDPVVSILKNYYGKTPMAAITGGSHQVVDMLLPKLGIDHFFQAVVCSDDTEKGKDSTEPYELACKSLGVQMNKCLFLDDGDIGLTGAKLAGMDTILVDIHHPDIFLYATI